MKNGEYYWVRDKINGFVEIARVDTWHTGATTPDIWWVTGSEIQSELDEFEVVAGPITLPAGVELQY